MFIRGRLLYLVSVIPENGNSVSKSVIVDAARNKVVAIFDNDTDPSADQDTLRYLATGGTHPDRLHAAGGRSDRRPEQAGARARARPESVRRPRPTSSGAWTG